ncbi:MAG TPA: alpha-amylase family glycosyl hydrolase, partial [Kribbellaceae bacterium]
FGFQQNATAFAQGKPTAQLRDFFTSDDYYTDTDSNAYELPTFLGNHDMGRIGTFLNLPGTTDAELLARDRLAHSLMYLTRGQPVVYYGDEQGFTGAGGDKDARQDLFATQTADYTDDEIVDGQGGTIGSQDRYDTTAPMYREIAALQKLRAAHPALADGAQIHRYSSNSPGLYAVSRIGADQVEYLVVANNSTAAKSAHIPTYLASTRFAPVYGADRGVTTDREGRATVTVRGLGIAVYRATSPLKHRTTAPTVYATTPAPGGTVGGRAEIAAAVPENAFSTVTFGYREVGTTAWRRLGSDDNAPYRVFHDVTTLPKGTLVEYRTVLKDASGNYSVSGTFGIVGDPAPSGGGGGGGGPVVQPGFVSVPGDHNDEMGCSGDWQPDCPQAQLTLDDKDKVWKGTYTIPAAEHAYKAAINKSWDENYGAGGVKNGANISYTAPGTPVTFYYEHGRHFVTSDAQGPIVTVPGSLQSELGCPADWSPDCMRPWLTDEDGDGTFSWSTTEIPRGNYEVKVTEGLSWDKNWGAGGAP